MHENLANIRDMIEVFSGDERRPVTPSELIHGLWLTTFFAHIMIYSLFTDSNCTIGVVTFF